MTCLRRRGKECLPRVGVLTWAGAASFSLPPGNTTSSNIHPSPFASCETTELIKVLHTGDLPLLFPWTSTSLLCCGGQNAMGERVVQFCFCHFNLVLGGVVSTYELIGRRHMRTWKATVKIHQSVRVGQQLRCVTKVPGVFWLSAP